LFSFSCADDALEGENNKEVVHELEKKARQQMATLTENLAREVALKEQMATPIEKNRALEAKNRELQKAVVPKKEHDHDLVYK